MKTPKNIGAIIIGGMIIVVGVIVFWKILSFIDRHFGHPDKPIGQNDPTNGIVAYAMSPVALPVLPANPPLYQPAPVEQCQFRFSLHMDVPGSVAVERSMDLREWEPAGSYYLPAGPSLLSLPAPCEAGSCFWRVTR